MKKEKKVVTLSPLPDLPVGTVFVFEGKKQKYVVTPRDDDNFCGGCVFEWEKLERGYCTYFRCYSNKRKDGQSVKAVKVRSSRRGKEV